MISTSLYLRNLLIVMICVTQYGLYAIVEDDAENELSYASGFTIRYKNKDKLITIKNPWKEGTNIRQYLLTNSQSKDRDETESNTVRINFPIQSAVVLSSPHIGFIRMLGKSDSIVGISSIGNVYDESIRKRIKNKITQ